MSLIASIDYTGMKFKHRSVRS